MKQVIKIIIPLLIIIFIFSIVLNMRNKQEMIDLTDFSDDEIFFPLIADFQNNTKGNVINANDITAFTFVCTDTGVPVENVDILVIDIMGNTITTLKSDKNGIAGISGLASNTVYRFKLSDSANSNDKRTFRYKTNNKYCSDYRSVFIITDKNYSREELNDLSDKYYTDLEFNANLNSLESKGYSDNWNYISGVYVFKYLDLLDTKIYINSRYSQTDSVITRYINASVSGAEVLDYKIKPIDTDFNVDYSNNEAVITGKSLDFSSLAKLIITFKKNGIIYKASKTIDVLANQEINATLKITLTMDNKKLSNGKLVIEPLSIGTSVSLNNKFEKIADDEGLIKMVIGNGTYIATKYYNNEKIDSIIFIVRRNEYQNIIF